MKLRAFTLIELLVVIAIIGVLSSIIVVGLSNARLAGRDSKRISDIKNIQLALSLYYNDNLTYPVDIYSGSLAPTYMGTVPKDPKDNTTGYTYVPLVPSSTCSPAPACNGSSPYTPVIRYHLGAVLDQTTNSGFGQDEDWAANPTINSQQYCRCSSSVPTSDFNGKDINSSTWKCTTGPGVVDQCYDVGP